MLEVKDIRSLHLLRNIYPDYVPWTGAAIHPTALVYLLNDIIIHDRNFIVECGSGISTIFIASVLKDQNKKGCFYSIDHDEDWIQIVKKYLKARDLLEYVTFVHAPLSTCNIGWENTSLWYDTTVLEEKIGSGPIDLLIVDGPPANEPGKKYSRYPAIPYFYKNLSDKYHIIVDDACRDAEIKIVKKWAKDYGLNFKSEIMKGDIWVCNEGAIYNVL